jgi:hypothetical protein
VGLEIVVQLPGHNKYNINKLVRLKILGLCFMENLADVVDRPLNGPDPCSWSRVLRLRGGRTTTFSLGNLLTPLGMLLHPFDDQHHAHRLRNHCNVQVQRLPWL